MGRVLTNTISLTSAREEDGSPGTLPGTPAMRLLEPNSIGKFGPSLKKMARMPISRNRMPRKPSLVDLDSTVDFELDITYDHVQEFVEALFFSVYKGLATYDVSAVTSTGYTVAADGDDVAQNFLIYAKGMGISGNNGLKVVGSGSTTTEVKTSGLTAETSTPAGATIEVCGVQGASADITMSSGGNLLATTLDFTTLSLTEGQFIWVGGDTAGTSFAVTANRGLARVTDIAAGQLTLDKKAATFALDNGSGKTVQLFFSKYCRNVPVDSADYLERTYTFELLYENLAGSGTDEYEYSIGNYCNEISFDFPLTSKAVMKCGFIGMRTDDPTTSRTTGFSAARPPISVDPTNTSSDLMRLRVTDADETGITTDFKSLSVAISNNVSPEKVLAYLGSRYINAGIIQIKLTAQVLFSSSLVIKRMRSNARVTGEIAWRNGDGGFVIDLPSMTIENGDKGFPVNQTVTISMEALAYQDATYNDCISLSQFAYMPAA